MSNVPFYIPLIFTAFGIAIGLMAAFWKPRKPINYDPPYYKGNGEPQPGVWSPSRAIGHEEYRVYNSKGEWERDKGIA